MNTFGPDLVFTVEEDTSVDIPFCATTYWQMVFSFPSSAATLDFDCADVGPNVVTVIVTDDAGNSTSCNATVTAEDNIAPVITCIGEPATVTDSATTAPGLPIDDLNTVVVSTLDVAADETITDLDVSLDLLHTWVGDLIVEIQSPSGTSVTIIDQPGVPASTFGCSVTIFWQL